MVVYATYDLTFPRAGSLAVVRDLEEHGIAHVAKVLPCGHYTTGEFPYKYLDGWFLGSFVWRAFREKNDVAAAGAGERRREETFICRR